MSQVKQTISELEEHLRDHFLFLRASSEAFDAGRTGEAKRIAVSLRVMFHDTKTSHSLLGQLNRLSGHFISTAMPHAPENQSTHGGLIMTAMKGNATTYNAPLDESITFRWLAFDEWWTEVVFVDDRREVLTRRNLVRAVSDQDGGAHVDPSLSETYARLSRHNSLGWVINPGDYSIPNAERAAVRQISHEVLKTFDPQYKKKSEIEADLIVGATMVIRGSKPPPLPRPAQFGRNERCPCGSGIKFKRCHGAR